MIKEVDHIGTLGEIDRSNFLIGLSKLKPEFAVPEASVEKSAFKSLAPHAERKFFVAAN
ncbi:hypothetical protein HJB67_01890 [Rhizobium lentis]|uniref:hypothetical protein n=1 Tax=Rhizobium lentis TaxID=1138194 RepID=UPI001C83D115|nr:hypothetical protein [Rhizobium lentis]MBX5008742.1 hypothetical protein [Rhizobium lentis]